MCLCNCVNNERHYSFTDFDFPVFLFCSSNFCTQFLHCISLRTPWRCKASRTARWYARRKFCPISSAAWLCSNSGLLAILLPPFLETMRRDRWTCCRFPGSGFLPDGNSISAPWHARVIDGHGLLPRKRNAPAVIQFCGRSFTSNFNFHKNDSKRWRRFQYVVN